MRKWRKSISLLMFMAVLMLMAGCTGQGEANEPEAEETISDTLEETTEEAYINMSGTVVADTMKLSAKYLSLKTGETAQLTADGEEEVTFTSSNPQVASVDEKGLVTALTSGNALIVAETEGKRATCGVMVDLTDTKIDLTEKTMTPVVYDLKIAKENSVMQGMTAGPDGTLYIIQQYNATPSDCIMTKIYPDGTQEYMRLVEFGHGNAIAVDFDEAGNDYLWIPSMGNVEGTSDGISRVPWESDAYYQEMAGTTYTKGIFENNPNASVDIESGRLLIYVDTSFYIYDLESFISGECYEPLLSGTLENSSTEGKPGSSYYQGIALYGEYIYRYDGDPGEDTYIYTFDLEGNWVDSYLVDGYMELAEVYREAEGLAICNGQVYVGFAGGAGGMRRANVFTFK